MPEPKISGKYVEAFIDSAGEVSSIFRRKASNILESNGITDVDPEGWYSMEKFVASMNEIEKEVGEKTSEQAGVKMVEVNDAVSNLTSMEESMEIGKELHQQSHKNFDVDTVGDMKYERLDNGNLKVAFYGGWEYPESLTHGIFKGYAKGVNGLTTNDVEPIEPEGDEVYAAEVYE